MYVDRKGNLTPGSQIKDERKRDKGGLTSLPGRHGQLRPIYCYQHRMSHQPIRSKLASCEELSSDAARFVHHSDLTTLYTVSSLIAFGEVMIAVGRKSHKHIPAAERWNGSKWKPIKPPPHEYTAAVKLNNSMLLACGSRSSFLKNCSVYNLESDEWHDTDYTKASLQNGEMVLIGHTVYAFGHLKSIQTLDLSSSLWSWKLDPHQLVVEHHGFGVWVIDEPTTSSTRQDFILVE